MIRFTVGSETRLLRASMAKLMPSSRRRFSSSCNRSIGWFLTILVGEDRIESIMELYHI